MRIFGLLCSLILGSVALSPWLGSCESANFCLNTFKIPCLRRICTTRNGVPARMGSAAWLEVFLTCDSCVGDRLVAESMKTRSFMRGPRGDFAHLLVLLAPLAYILWRRFGISSCHDLDNGRYIVPRLATCWGELALG